MAPNQTGLLEADVLMLNEHTMSVLQISRGKKDTLGIIFHTIPLKRCRDPLLEQSHQDGSNEGSQHMFSLRNKNYL